MDKTYVRLVAARDKAAGDVQGAMTTDMAPDRLESVLAWTADVCAVKDPAGMWPLAAAIPPEVPPMVAGKLLTAQTMVAGYTPSAKEARVAKLIVKANKAGGLYASRAGKYAVNLQGGCGQLMALDKDLANVKAALAEAYDEREVTVERVPVGSAAHVYRDVAVLAHPDWEAPLVLCDADQLDEFKAWVTA